VGNECEDAQEFLDRMANLDKELSEKLNRIHQEEAERFNSHRRSRRSFQVGDQVWLIRPKKVGGHKISTWWQGPYTIVRQLGKDVYTIDVGGTSEMQVHEDQLKPHFGKDALEGGIPLFYHHTDPEKLNPMEVDYIRDHREGPGGPEFLVHWKGAPNACDTWERPESFVIIPSQQWAEYCKEHGLFPDLHTVPVYQSQGARVTPDC